RQTYATTQSRIYLDVVRISETRLEITGASEDGIQAATVIVNGEIQQRLAPADDPRIVTAGLDLTLAPNDFCYVRLTTDKGNMAWSSPTWGDRA
ncbi:MAG: hypothetical protein LC725_05010, partial [Lentisphaerae bacterium]|nr:hypothetical protein [Lentisphaerota bacterium]